MSLESLNKLIRTEPVCLWIGSGFSIAAGMPSVTDLKERLFASLSPEEQEQVDKEKNLRDFAYEFETLKGRQTLIEILKHLIQRPPITTYDHDVLARISHFRSIVTSNYDTLIEDSSKLKTAVITCDEDISTSRLAKRRVYKIHGDIKNPESIVITSNDYARQYNRLFKDPFWASVIDQIASHHVVFLGYGYEDENVWADFEHVHQKLGKAKNQLFFISPKISAIKSKRLEQMGIKYISATGEQFLNQLIENIKKNLKDDLAAGRVDTQVAQDFITNFDLNATFSGTKSGTELVSISRADGLTEQHFSMDIIDPKVIADYQKFRTGYESKTLKITANQVSSFNLSVEGFHILGQDNLAQFQLQHAPQKKGSCTISFKDHRFTLKNVRYKLYNSVPGKTLLEVIINGYQFDITICAQKASSPEITYKSREPEGSLSAEKRHQFFHAAFLLFSGEKMSIHLKGLGTFSHKMQRHPHVSMFDENRKIYNALLLIQKRLGVSFKPLPPGGLEQDEFQKVLKLMNLITNGYYCIEEPQGITMYEMPDDRDLYEQFKSMPTKGLHTFLVTKMPHEMELLGTHIYLGDEQVVLKEPTITKSDYDTRTVTLVPSDGLICYFYRRFGHREVATAVKVWDGGS